MAIRTVMLLSSWLFLGNLCANAQANPIRGTIQNVMSAKGDYLGRFLIDKQAWVFVTKTTKVFRSDGKDLKAATFDDLKAGLTVQARHSGEIRDSFPPQVDADEIVILDDKKVPMRGTITKITLTKNAKDFGFLHVEGPKDQTFDKAIIRLVFDKTKVFTLEGKERKAATFKYLKVGLQVEARFDAPNKESYPVQVSADEIVILADKPRADVRGTVVNVTFPKNSDPTFVCRILVEEPGRKKGEVASANITTDTKLFKVEGKDRRPADVFSDLKIGVQIEMRFADAHHAAEIVIRPDEKK